MTATLDDELADLRRSNAELQRRLNEALCERDESLQREAATTEVIRVINSSPGDLALVFEAILENALRVCEAAFGFMASYDGEHFHLLMAGRGWRRDSDTRGSTCLFTKLIRLPRAEAQLPVESY